MFTMKYIEVHEIKLWNIDRTSKLEMTLSRTDISREYLAKNLAEIGLSKNYRLVGGQRIRNRMAKILDIAGHT